MLIPASIASSNSFSASTETGSSSQSTDPPTGFEVRVSAGKCSATSAAMRSAFRFNTGRSALSLSTDVTAKVEEMDQALQGMWKNLQEKGMAETVKKG